MAKTKPTGAVAEVVDLDELDERWAKAEELGGLDIAIARSLIASLKEYQKGAEHDLRWIESLKAERNHHRRRIEALRSGLRGIGEIRCLGDMQEMAKACRDELAADTARAKRFQRKAARRG